MAHALGSVGHRVCMLCDINYLKQGDWFTTESDPAWFFQLVARHATHVKAFVYARSTKEFQGVRRINDQRVNKVEVQVDLLGRGPSG